MTVTYEYNGAIVQSHPSPTAPHLVIGRSVTIKGVIYRIADIRYYYPYTNSPDYEMIVTLDRIREIAPGKDQRAELA